eukprot:g45412.t1
MPITMCRTLEPRANIAGDQAVAEPQAEDQFFFSTRKACSTSRDRHRDIGQGYLQNPAGEAQTSKCHSQEPDDLLHYGSSTAFCTIEFIDCKEEDWKCDIKTPQLTTDVMQMHGELRAFNSSCLHRFRYRNYNSLPLSRA